MEDGGVEQGGGAGEGYSLERGPDEELLAKLEEANRMLEMDEKAFPSLSGRSPTPGHSRKGSGSSLVSTTSSNSQFSNQLSNDSEDVVANSSQTIWEVWGCVVNDWDSVRKKVSFLRDLVRKGIPHEFRGMAWQLLLGVHDSPDKQLYAEYMKKTSPSEKLIRRDIARTFPEHDFFKEKDGFGQESLFNVMKAYSLHDREVGYCQGSGFIVGLLLMQMPEEDAFAVLVRLMQGYKLRELFKPSMAELGLCMFKLEYLIQDLLPALQVHFHTQSFDTSMYASSWFLTLFTTSLPLPLARRVMDLFISEGMEMVFRVAVAILQTCQEDLLALDMEGLLKYLQKDLRCRFDTEADQELLLQTSFQVRYSSKKMKKLEKDYTALKSKENEEQIELRRLRTENRLLRQRIENLEKVEANLLRQKEESASLADRLIQDQVTRAQEAEESYALKKQLSITRQQLQDTQARLSEAQAILGDIKRGPSLMQGAELLDAAEEQNVVQHLQEELIAVRLREAEAGAFTKELKNKIRELEDTIVRLQRAPSNDVQHLQEELIAVKLREAEANLSLKELRQKVNEIESYWEAHMERRAVTASPREKNSKSEVRHLQEEVMSIKLREAHALADLKDSKQKVMELETQNQICQNQIRRMDDDNKMLKQQLAEAAERERDLRANVKDLERKLDDAESKRKEEAMMARIKEAESVQIVAELRQKIAEIDIQDKSHQGRSSCPNSNSADVSSTANMQIGTLKEEVLAAGQFQTTVDKDDLESQLLDLQDQVIQLKMSTSPRTDNNFNNIMTASFLTQHDSDDEWDVEVRDSENLDRTLSDIIEGRSPFSTPSKPIPRFDSLDGSGFGLALTRDEGDSSVCTNMDSSGCFVQTSIPESSGCMESSGQDSGMLYCVAKGVNSLDEGEPHLSMPQSCDHEVTASQRLLEDTGHASHDKLVCVPSQPAAGETGMALTQHNGHSSDNSQPTQQPPFSYIRTVCPDVPTARVSGTEN